MTAGGPGAKDAPHAQRRGSVLQGKMCCLVSGGWSVRAMLTWVGENSCPTCDGPLTGSGSCGWTLGVGFIVGLATYVGGYVLRCIGDDGVLSSL